METCRHDKPEGRTRCAECHAAYNREWRKTAVSLSIKSAQRKGFEEGVRAARIVLLEAGDSSLTGFTAAEMVRRLGLD